MLNVSGRVVKPNDVHGSFTGHRVLLSYRVAVSFGASDEALTGGAAGQPAEHPADPPGETNLAGVAGAPLASDGAFALAVPDARDLRAPIEIAVLAPSGTVLAREGLTVEGLFASLDITATPVQPFVVRPDSDGLGQPKRITGRAIGLDGHPAATGVPVVLFGVDGQPGAGAHVLLTITTQVGGYFAAPWPSEALVAAYAEVAGARASLPLVDGHLPDRVILVADLPHTSDECGCAPNPPRAPEAVDLVANSAAYSQDLGGGCVNLTMPNRIIEEYPYFTIVRITEPDVRPMNTEPPRRLPPGVLRELAGLVADDRRLAVAEEIVPAEPRILASNTPGLLTSLDTRRARELLADPTTITRETVMTAAIKSEAVDLHHMIDLLGARPTRTELDGQHSIDWDDTPTIYESTTVALGHVLHFRQVWRADGYSLGDLLYSLPLAPGQKRLVSTLDWTRRTAGRRDEVLESEEEMAALLSRDRDISEIVGSHLDERIDGGSSSSTSAGGGGLGFGFIGTGFGVFGGVAGGASSSDSSSWQDSSRTLSANSLQQLRDRTNQRAAAVRSVRSTTIQTVTQGENVRAETEVVANHNHCHAMTVEYFEVLRHFQVSEELAYVSECVFVPLPMLPFDRAKARRWRATLIRWLRRPQLASGFDAIERIATNWVGWDFPEHRFSEEAAEELDGEMRVSFVIPRPHDEVDGAFKIDAWSWLTPFLGSSPLFVFNQMADSVNSLFRDINRVITAEMYVQIQRARDDYFAREIAPRIAEQIVHRMRFAYVTRNGIQTELPMDATLVSKYVDGVPLYVSIRANGMLPAVPREDITRFRVYLDDRLFAGLPFTFNVVPPEARILVRSAKARYRSPHMEHVLFDDPRVNNDLSDGDDVLIAAPTSFDERRDPRADDRRAADALVKHLNEHLEYYHQTIWLSLDPQRRYMLLDGIIAPNAGGRSIASVVENRLIGIVGNCMVLPVTSGIHLDPTLAPDPETGRRADLMHAYAADPAPPTRISVPTRGVYAEAIMGACDACEKKDDTRFWRWEESPLPDEPTAIEPISTASRQATDASGAPSPLPQPIVNIQNAPGLPDPLGLSQALEVLGRSDIFREASGLAGTQKNALAAFQGVMDVAKSFGGTAAQLAQQQEMGRNVDRTMEQIKSAQSSGMLSQQQAAELAHAALQSLAGDGGSSRQNPVHDPEVSKAIEKATESGSGRVTVTSPGETVSASFDDGDAGTAGEIGGAFIPKTEIIEAWLDIPLVMDELTAVPPLMKYSKSKTVDTLDELQQMLLQVGSTEAVDVFPLFRSANLLREHPAGGNRFQVGLRMQVCYPTKSGTPGIAGVGKLPVAVLAHGRHRAFESVNVKPAVSRTITIPTIAGPKSLPVHDAEAVNPKLSLLGYTYLQQELARQGIVSVSVDARVPDVFNQLIETRADLILGALDYLAKQSITPGSIYAGRVDLASVGLMGHSRGGDAVVRAAKKNASPFGPPTYGIRAVCSVAPTDFTGGAAPADRHVLEARETDFYLVLYGALDGDVSGGAGPVGTGPSGTGFRHYDRARCAKSMAFANLCIHNSFNAIWHGDPPLDSSDPRKLDEKGHQTLAVEYIGDLFRWKLKNESSLAGRFDGRVSNSLATPVSTEWLYGTSVKFFEDFEQGATNLLGGSTAVTLPGGSANVAAVRDENHVTHGGTPGTPLGILMPHQTHVLQLEWGGPRATGIKAYTTDVPAAHQDWSAFDTLLVSLGGYHDPASQATIDAEWFPRVRLVLSDTAGGIAVVDWNAYGATAPSKPLFTMKDGVHPSTMMRLETVPVKLALFRPGVDLHKVKQLALELEPASIVTTFVDSIHIVKR